jgi:hypothetical protein
VGSIPTGRSITGGTQMHDSWILAFVFRGLVAASGDTMTLAECEARGKDLNPGATQVVCINTSNPACRIYREPTPMYDGAASCRRRIKPNSPSTL